MIYMVLLFIWRFIYKKRLGEEENLTCLGNRDIFAVSWLHFPIWPPFWISPLFWINNWITVIIFAKIHYKHHTCIIHKASNAFIAHTILLSSISFFWLLLSSMVFISGQRAGTYIRVITKLPNSEQSYKGKVKTLNYINRQNQSTTGKLWKP